MSSPLLLMEKVTLTFECKNLPRQDILSKSDPMLVLYRIENGKKQLIGRTDPIMNNEDPKFDKRFELDFFFEQIQLLFVEIYDIDTNHYDNLQEHDFLGCAQFSLASVMSSTGSMLSMQLKDKKNELVFKSSFSKKDQDRALIIINGDKVQSNRNKIQFQIKCNNLHQSSLLFGKDDVQLKVLSVRENNTHLTIYKSEIRYKQKNPLFNLIKLDVSELCNCNIEAPIIIRLCYIKNDNDEHIIGDLRITLAEILNGQPLLNPELESSNAQKVITSTQQYDLINPIKKKSFGTLEFLFIEQSIEYTFLDYVQGGLDLRLTIAIDFTASNGNHKNANSLHHLSPTTNRNDYTDAIYSIGDIITSYCKKNFFPALGFGAFVSIDNKPSDTSHCFPLSLSTSKPYAMGIPHLIELYKHCLLHTELSGPTYFHELIQSATITAQQAYSQTSQHFDILLILTDGVINDMGQTIDAIVQASRTPLSIIIIGVGRADFGQFMEKLDSDDELLKSPKYGVAERDIVQFVPFLQFANNPSQLAANVLQEIPAQITQFMAMRKIKPLHL